MPDLHAICFKYRALKAFFQKLAQTDQIEQISAILKINQQVNVT